MAETKARHIANLVEDDGDVKSAHLDNITVTPTAVSDQANTSTGYLDLPAGTTAQRPTLDNSGGTRFNTTTGSLEFYDGANWVSTNLIPTINSITGTIYAGASSTLTLSVTSTTDTIDVKYYESGTLIATDSGLTVTSGSATSTVPSAVYGQTAGDTISIQVVNQDGTPSSNNIDKTVLGLPTGGTVDTTSVSGYRIHTFTSTANFTNTINNLSAQYLVIAGGGGGASGGGGAGGYRCNVPGETSGDGNLANNETSLTLPGSASGTNTLITVGGGGAGGDGQSNIQGTDGDPSSIGNLITTVGGGGGGVYVAGGASGNGSGGGSGGGGGKDGGAGAAGTLNQGKDGGTSQGGSGYAGAGGGGASQAGQSGLANEDAGDGGDGQTSSINGTPTVRAGGGGGGTNSTNSANKFGQGGNGGGGRAGANDLAPVAGTDGTGGGGGAGGFTGNRTGGTGGDGIVIIRYQLP